jgi:hypothetical protein
MSTIRAGNTSQTALTYTSDTTGQLNLEASSGIVNTSSNIGGLILPKGTTIQRPVTPAAGMLRYNTTTSELEVYSDGWLTVASRAPTVVAVSPVTYNGESGTQFTITGTNFISGAQVYFVDSSNVEYAANSVIVVSSTSITAQTPQDFTVAQEPLKIKIVQTTGTVVSGGLIDTGNTPAWTTASGSIGTIYDSNRVFTTTIVATDPDSSSTIAYSLQSGSLPTGLSLNTSTGVISGTATAVVTDTTSTFTIRATDNAGNTSDREFTILVKAPVTVVYNYSGATATFTVPTGVTTLTAKMWGGGGGSYSFTGSGLGGGAGYSTGSWTVTAGQTYVISVGGAGATGSSGVSSPGGFGGGGAGGENTAQSASRSGAGGGYSGIFITSVSQANAYLMAGGGGGASGQNGGAGGGSSGTQGSYGAYAGRIEGGYGGTQSAGGSGGNSYDSGTAASGSALQGGAGNNIGTSGWSPGGGGGGGYFGGGGGAGGGASTGGGGGGSGYVRSGVTGSTTAGSGTTAANSSDTDRTGNAGNSSTNGLVILKY